MTQVKHIRKMYFEEGKNISQISRETGHDRKTVRGYLNKEDWNKELPKVKKEAGYPKLEPFKAEIDSWLIADKRAKRKQKHTQNGYMTGWLRSIRMILTAPTEPLPGMWQQRRKRSPRSISV